MIPCPRCGRPCRNLPNHRQACWVGYRAADPAVTARLLAGQDVTIASYLKRIYVRPLHDAGTTRTRIGIVLHMSGRVVADVLGSRVKEVA